MAKEKEKGGILETVKTIVYALLIAGVFRTLFFQPFWIPSGSMKDTLLIGDFLFVNKMSYGYSYASCPSIRLPQIGIDIDAKDICGWLGGDNERLFGSEPERGDIVVFRHPVHGTDFIKRLIGLPGDRIQVKNGLLYINDEPVQVERNGQWRCRSEIRQIQLGWSSDPCSRAGHIAAATSVATSPIPPSTATIARAPTSSAIHPPTSSPIGSP